MMNLHLRHAIHRTKCTMTGWEVQSKMVAFQRWEKKRFRKKVKHWNAYFQDQNLITKKESPPVIDVFIKHKKLLLLSKVEKGCRIENLRLNFCKENRLNPSSTKFLYDGQRIHEDDSPNSLEMVNGDTIEVFHEMRGGGLPQKKQIWFYWHPKPERTL